MKLKLALLLFIISGTLAAQSIPKGKIHGKWVCKKMTVVKGRMTEMLPDTTDQKMKEMWTLIQEGFKGIEFTFTPEGKFLVKGAAAADNPVVSEMLPALNGKSWGLDANGNIHIGGSENLMDIKMVQENGKTFFYLGETPIVLEMEKAKS